MARKKTKEKTKKNRFNARLDDFQKICFLVVAKEKFLTTDLSSCLINLILEAYSKLDIPQEKFEEYKLKFYALHEEAPQPKTLFSE